jgi:hypothetical protein
MVSDMYGCGRMQYVRIVNNRLVRISIRDYQCIDRTLEEFDFVYRSKFDIP